MNLRIAISTAAVALAMVSPAALADSPPAVVSSDYSMRPSSSGVTGDRFGVLLASDTSDCWRARVYYRNTQNETIEGPGGNSITPDYIWRQAQGCAGQSELEWEYTHALRNAQVGTFNEFAETDGVEIDVRSDFDASGGSFNYSVDVTRDSTDDMDIVHSVERYEDASGETLFMTQTSSKASLLDDPVTVNGVTVNDVAVVSYPSHNRVRVFAKGLGLIMAKHNAAGNFWADPVFRGNSTVFKAVWIRNQAGEKGRLVETPFAPGNAFGDFF